MLVMLQGPNKCLIWSFAEIVKYFLFYLFFRKNDRPAPVLQYVSKYYYLEVLLYQSITI